MDVLFHLVLKIQEKVNINYLKASTIFGNDSNDSSLIE